MADWAKIRADYISSSIGYRDLAKKHKVSFTTLSRKAGKENWQQMRQQREDREATLVVKSLAEKGAKKSIKIEDVADKLLDKVAEAIDTLVIDTASLKQLTSALNDLAKVKGYKSEADMREQEARIEKLRKEAEDDTPEDRKVNVTFIGDVEEYSK